MRYARSDVTAFTSGVTGHTHTLDDNADPDSDVLAIDCVSCEAELANDKLWAGSRDEVPLTLAEKKTAEKQEKEAQLVTAQFAQALAEGARAHIAEQAAAAPAKKAPAKRAPRKAAAK